MNQSNTVKQGFTLVEIMIVVLIGSLLMAMGFGGYRWLKRAKEQENTTKLSNIDSLLELYNQRIGEYPQELNELIEGPQKPALQRKWGEAMAKPADLLDSWSHPFEYDLNARGAARPYELYSRGSTGEAHINSPFSQE